MRIVTWNMAAGFGYDPERHERAWCYLRDELRPDAALLQEVVIPEWTTDVWPSVVATRKHPPSPGRLDVAWGSAIVSPSSFEVFEPTAATAPWLDELRGSAVVGRIDLDRPLWLASLHSSSEEIDEARFVGDLRRPRRQCSPLGIWEIDVLVEELERLFGDQRFIAGGDLNSALLMDEVYREDSCTQLFANLADAGFCDLRPRFSPTEVQTFFRKGNQPYQLDHVYADADTEKLVTDWRVVCEVAHSDRDLSDHAPIVVEVDLT